MLTVSQLEKAHGDRTLFRDVTFSLQPGRRIALVGGNGVGKTTLLEIVIGAQPPDAGSVTKPADYRVGYLPQDLTDTPTGTVLDEAMRGAGDVTALAERIHDLQHLVADTEGAAHDRALAELGEAQSAFEHIGGYAIEAEAHRVLAGLGFRPSDAERPVAELSGGWRMRAALARLLVSDPDVLLLDEPTNHLDVDSVAWLEDQLMAFRGSILFVSHDRDFMDNVANRVIEIAGGVATEYVGNFAEFVVAREERIAQAEARAAAQARKVADTEKFIERFRYKATKARQVQSRIKAIERLEAIEIPTVEQVRAKFKFPEPPRSSRVVTEMHGVVAGYDDEVVLRGVSLAIERGMKVGFVGPNGAGKTTLLKLILGEIEPLEGAVERGQNLEVGSFAQHQVEVLNLNRSVVDEFRGSVPEKEGRNLRTLLGAFGFSGDAAERKVADLSGGERTRLALGKIMVEPHNLLVLDEPTNHLDLPSCDILEDALRAYQGTVLLVTHDRHLLRSVATSLVEVRDGRAIWHPGVDEAVLKPSGPTSRRGHADGAVSPAAPSQAQRRPPASAPRPGGRGGKEQRQQAAARRQQRSRATKGLRSRVQQAERAWERAEAEVADLQRQLADPGTYGDPQAVADLAARHDAAKEAAARAMEAWEAAASELEQVEASLES